MTAIRPVAPTVRSFQLPMAGAFKQAKTRILLLYAALMLAAVGVSVPIFRALVFAEVDQRVEADLLEEVEAFQSVYANWEASDDPTLEALVEDIDVFVNETIPEDDNFFIVLLDEAVYRNSPLKLPSAIGPQSSVMEKWRSLDTYTLGDRASFDPAVGKILYVVQPLVVDGQLEGQFVVAHLAAGERQEALAGVYVFGKVSVGLIAIAFGLAWQGTGRLLRPVKDLATTAKAINESDLGQRIEVQGTGELAELTDTFNAMMNRIQAAFNSQRDFINDAGHELRTPITIIQGHLELMGDDPQDRTETMAVVMDELDRMGRMVNELILLVKAGRPDFLHSEPIRLAAFTQELYGKAKMLAERDWQLRLEADSDRQIVADRQRLTGALLNLLSNAAQHTTAADSIELGCRLRGSQVEFWVKDTGEGIPEAEQTRIFERFARVQHTHRRSDGSGLGLAIVKAIAEAHGGQVSLSSQYGAGSTFTVTIPQRPAGAASGAASGIASGAKPPNLRSA